MHCYRCLRLPCSLLTVLFTEVVRSLLVFLTSLAVFGISLFGISLPDRLHPCRAFSFNNSWISFMQSWHDGINQSSTEDQLQYDTVRCWEIFCLFHPNAATERVDTCRSRWFHSFLLFMPPLFFKSYSRMNHEWINHRNPTKEASIYTNTQCKLTKSILASISNSSRTFWQRNNKFNEQGTD